MAGPLSSERPVPDGTLTGGPDTSVSREMAQDAKQVRRTKHMERPARLGSFAVNTASPLSKTINQKTREPKNLRVKEQFKKRRLRK